MEDIEVLLNRRVVQWPKPSLPLKSFSYMNTLSPQGNIYIPLLRNMIPIRIINPILFKERLRLPNV